MHRRVDGAYATGAAGYRPADWQPFDLDRHPTPGDPYRAPPAPTRLGPLPAPNPVAYVHTPHTWSDPLGLAPLCHRHGGDTGSPGGLGILPGPASQKAADMLDKVNALPGGKYKEWDVNAKADRPACSAPGCGKEIKGPERLLTPKDGPGPAHYTPDHHGTFYYVGEFTG